MKYHCQTFRGDDGTLEMYEDIVTKAKNHPSEVIIDKEETSFTKEGDYTVVLRWWQRENDDNDNFDLLDIVENGGL